MDTKLNTEMLKLLKYFYVAEWNYISFHVSCENVYFVMLNEKEMIFNSLDREKAIHVYQDLKDG